MFEDDLPITVEEDADAAEILGWQAGRRKPESGGQPVGGFGPRGLHTLWLPSDGGEDKLVVRNGRPVNKRVGLLSDDVDLMRLRGELIMGLRRVDTCVYDAPASLAEYAIRLIRANYNVTDEDLTFLLFSGSTEWATGIIRHALGGDHAVAALQYGDELADLLLERASRELQNQPVIPVAPAPPRRRWWQFWR